MKRITTILIAILLISLGRSLWAAPPDTYIWQREVISGVGSGADPLKTELQSLVTEMMNTGSPSIDNGKLQEGLYRVGILQNFLLYGAPAETVYVLSDVYPYLDSTTQASVRTYLTSFMSTFPPLSRSYIHGTTTWGNVAMDRNRREYYPMPPSFMVNIYPAPSIPLEVCYVMWRYADATGDWAYLNTNMSAIQTIYNTYTAPATRYGQIMGLVGMARIAYHFNNTTLMNDAVTKATAAINASNFDTWLSTGQTNFTRGGHDWCFPVFHYMRSDFPVGAYFCPEIGRFIGAEQTTAAQTATSFRIGATFATQAQATYPAWFINRADYAYGEYIYKNVTGWGQNFQGGENAYNTPDFSWTFYMLRAYVYNDSASDLTKMVDMPTCVGDLFYMQKLSTAVKAYGTRTWVDVRTGGGTPAAPSNLVATAVSSSQINLTWTDNATDETGFKVERKTGAGGTYAQIATPGVNATSYNNTGLAASTNYYYRIRATNANGDSSYSNEANATTSAGSPPAAPSNLIATAASASQINLTWADNASNETGFKLERKLGAGGTYAQIATPAANATSYNDTGLAASTTYYYRIRATNGNGDSAYSNEANATTQAGGGGGNLIINGDFETGTISSWSWNGPSTGGSISTADKHGGVYSAKFDATVGKPELDQSFTTATGTQYTVTGWVRIVTQTGSDWGGFRVQASDANWTALGSVSLIQATTGTNWYQFTFNFTAASTSSRLQVGQFSGAGLVQVVYADDLSVTGPGGSPPAAPSALSATAVSSSQINLAWTDNATTESGFKVERKLGAGGTYAQIATPAANATSYNDTGLASSTNYYYRVRATNGSGDSAYSNEANATTQTGPPAAPSNLAASAVSSSQINLTWTDNASNETGFKLERKTGAGGTYAQIATPAVNAVSYNDTGLAANTTYYYRIRATNAGGDSAYSNEANATTNASSPIGLAFNGTSSKASANDSASLDIAGNTITMEAWVYLTGPNLWNYMQVVGRQVISTGNGFNNWHGIGGYSNGNQWKFGLVIGPTFYIAQNSGTLSNNQWYHMAGSYDGSNIRFFINGVVVATTAITGNLTVNNNTWNLGSNGSGEWLQGSIDEVRISNNARYTANFTPPTAAFSNDANTKALWHMNENTGTTSTDSSGNSNTLTLTSTTWTIGKF